MKKFLLSVIVLATVYSLSAQQVTVTEHRMTGTNNSSTSVPPFIKTSFEAQYPGVTVIVWEPVNTYWRATYNKDNRVSYVYYDDRGENYRVVLPVVQNYVPEEVITKALTTHSPVYGIMKMKSADNSDIYHIVILENGMTKSVWMDANGTAVTNVFRIKTEEGSVTVSVQ